MTIWRRYSCRIHITWAQRYYLHYPKVAIGHWPPGFYIMEGLWWLLLPPSRGTALLLNAVLMLLAGIIFYRLLRAFAPPWLCLAAALLLIATPVVEQSYSQTMGDLPCLLWSVLLADAMVRLMRRPSFASASLVALWLICGLLTKGTAASLVLAPVIACLITGQWRILKSRFVLSAAAAVMLLGFGWYVIENAVFHENLRNLSGVAVAVPWSGGIHSHTGRPRILRAGLRRGLRGAAAPAPGGRRFRRDPALHWDRSLVPPGDERAAPLHHRDPGTACLVGGVARVGTQPQLGSDFYWGFPRWPCFRSFRISSSLMDSSAS